MRKYFLSVGVVLTIASSMMFTSCIGSFALTNKLLTWNNQIGNKFLNEIVFFAFWIIPVYEVTSAADLIVLNTVEFWSGSNPIAMGIKVIKGHDGDYLVECDGKGYTITSKNDGSKVRLSFDESDRSWSVTANDHTVKFMSFIDDSHVKVIGADGNFTTVELNEQGLIAYRESVLASMWAYN